MATRKINRKKNLTQRKKYKKRGNKLLNTQKRIRKQSKINRQLMRKQTYKINRCKKCKRVKNLKISKKKLDKLRNAGWLLSDAAGYLKKNALLCCGSDAALQDTMNSDGKLIPKDPRSNTVDNAAIPNDVPVLPEAIPNDVPVLPEAIPNDVPVLPEAIPNHAPVLPEVSPNDGPLHRLRRRVEPFTFSRRGEAVAEAVAVAEKKQAAAKKKQELKTARDNQAFKDKLIHAIIKTRRRELEMKYKLRDSMRAYEARKKNTLSKKNPLSKLSPVGESEQNLMPADPHEGSIDV